MFYIVHMQLYNCITRKVHKHNKNLEFSVLKESAIKALKQAAVKMKHKLSVCILIPTVQD